MGHYFLPPLFLINQDFFAFRKIVEQRGIELRPSGAGRWKALCPFHHEKTPSFFLFEKSNKFYCFGCGEGGDVIDFVRKMDGVSFQEAMKRLTGGGERHPIRWVRPGPEVIRKRRLIEAFREWEVDASNLYGALRCAAYRMIQAGGPERLDDHADLVRMIGVLDQYIDILASRDDRRKLALYRAVMAGEATDYVCD